MKQALRLNEEAKNVPDWLRNFAWFTQNPCVNCSTGIIRPTININTGAAQNLPRSYRRTGAIDEAVARYSIATKFILRGGRLQGREEIRLHLYVISPDFYIAYSIIKNYTEFIKSCTKATFVSYCFSVSFVVICNYINRRLNLSRFARDGSSRRVFALTQNPLLRKRF
jgi:hypothetical protein